MPQHLSHPNDYELVGRNSDDANETFDLDESDFQSQGLTSTSFLSLKPSRLSYYFSWFYPFSNRSFRKPIRHGRKRSTLFQRFKCIRLHRPSARLCTYVLAIFVLLLALTILTAILNPSYSTPPIHYVNLRARVENSEDYGRANPEHQKIFIAASLYDSGGHLLDGDWGRAVLNLIDILGNRNVYLSIYETYSDEAGQLAHFKFDKKVQCPHALVLEESSALDDLPQITLPDGSLRTKRIAYLAESRNKALQPLDDDKDTVYDKLLFLNDVIFDPIEAAQLLLATNFDEHGHTSYRAACAVDFINPFKFYDTYATRDLEGFSMGVPFFPWFTNVGQGHSRADVLAGKDAVRVKSCWGGMVAFDAKPFQGEPPLRFRATEDMYWDASECCLIHADILKEGTFENDGDYVGVYLNPFVRVAYGNSTFSWLPTVQRFERLFSIPQNVVNHVVGLPWFNPRREESVGAQVEEKVWIPDTSIKSGGSYQIKSREAQGDGYCGVRMLQVIKETPREGEKNWEILPVPAG